MRFQEKGNEVGKGRWERRAVRTGKEGRGVRNGMRGEGLERWG